MASFEQKVVWPLLVDFDNLSTTFGSEHAQEPNPVKLCMNICISDLVKYFIYMTLSMCSKQQFEGEQRSQTKDFFIELNSELTS